MTIFIILFNLKTKEIIVKRFCVLLFMCVFSAMLFVGCGYEGGTTVTGIAFTSKEYYVDLGVLTLIFSLMPDKVLLVFPFVTFIFNFLDDFFTVSLTGIFLTVSFDLILFKITCVFLIVCI